MGRLRTIVLAMLLICAAPVAHGLDTGEAVHLLLRTGFGAAPADVQKLAGLTRAQAVKRLLDTARTGALTPPPPWVDGPRPDWAAHWQGSDELVKQAFNQQRDREAIELKAWWYAEMLATPSPFTERMTLFWHGHFPSSMDKVRAPDYLYRQNLLFRRHALGNFRTLLRAIARDPAMLRYLDTVASKKGAPNENFARELFELFVLGIGNYTERDVKDAARAFTGWRVDETTGQFAYAHRDHDEGDKTVLGRSGNLDGDGVIDAVLDHPAAARHVVSRLWLEFVSDVPDRAEISRLAQIFRAANYELKPLMNALLTGAAFWAPANRGTLVKSPVEFAVGTIRTFDLALPDTRPLVEFGRRLRQDVFNPPNVRGWPGGTAWISSFTLLARRDLADRLLRGQELVRMQDNQMMMMAAPSAPIRQVADAGRGPGVAGWVAAHGSLLQDPVLVAGLILARPPMQPEAMRDAGGAALVERLLLDPAYHLK